MKKTLCGLLLGMMAVVPGIVNARPAEADFDQFLNDGKFVAKSIVPENKDAAESIFNYLINDTSYEIDLTTCNEGYTNCDMVYNITKERKNIDIEYEYDENVKALVDSIKGNFNASENNGVYTSNVYTMNFLEYLDFIINNHDDNRYLSVANYSKEYRNALNNYNFDIEVTYSSFGEETEEEFGNQNFITFDGVIYYYFKGNTANERYNISLLVKNIIHIDENATDVMAAVKEELTKYLGNEDFEISENGSVSDLIASRQSFYTEEDMQYYFYNENGPLHYLLEDDTLDTIYNIKIDGGSYYFVVKKGNVLENINVESKDVLTGVQIKASNLVKGTYTIDTVRLTEGEDFNKVINVLNVSNFVMYDVNLYNFSQKKYVTKLDNGEFEIRIPLTDSLKGKLLVTYYVDENGNKVSIETKEENGYAVFKTNHLSIYTVAENVSANPKTYDGIMTWVGLGIASIVGLGTILVIKKRKKI